MENLLIFDLDDTLVNTHEIAYIKTNYIASKYYGLNLEFSCFKENYGKFDFNECVKKWFNGKINHDEFRHRYNIIAYETFIRINQSAI